MKVEGEEVTKESCILKSIVIVGGGISGLCSAYYLVKEGHKVTVLDKGDLSGGASLINAGYITPSHFISFAAPGMITKGIKWMFNSYSPFYIKPRWDPEFFKWAWNFKRSATAEKVEQSVEVLKNISLKSRGLYEEIYDSEDFRFHYENKGLLSVYSTIKGRETELNVMKRAQKEGLEAVELSRQQLLDLQPGFSEMVTGAVHYKCDSHTTPGEFMAQMKKWLELKGVDFHLNQEVKHIRTHSNKVTSVETNNDNYEADEFVFATGSWTSRLLKELGLNIPIQGGKGYSMDVHRPLGVTIPAVLVEAKVGITPMNGFVRFAGTMEFSGNNDNILKNRVEAIAASAGKYYSEITVTDEEKSKARSGLRPVSPDGLPFIGRTSKFDNLTVAAGHAMIGWSLGPATGKLVAQIINNQKPMLDLRPFDPERFHQKPFF